MFTLFFHAVMGVAPAGASDSAISTSDAPASLDLSSAMGLRPLSEEELEWLRPVRKRLPQNPYAQTDFTAYTLEWGEARLGLGRIGLGLLPRTQVSTVPTLDALGIYNGEVKVNALRAGPLDVAAEFARYHLPLGEFTGSQTSWGGSVSLRLLEPWSFHVAGRYSVLSAQGLPDLGKVSPVLQLVETNLWDYDISEVAPDYQLDLRAQVISARVATDVRVNRRDSVILQGQATLWGGMLTDIDEEIPAVMGVDLVLEQDESGQVSVKDSYAASLSWQLSWRRADLRVGAGISSVPGAWLLQSTEMSWRFGGRTRLREGDMRQGWRRNRRALRLAQVRTRLPQYQPPPEE